VIAIRQILQSAPAFSTVSELKSNLVTIRETDSTGFSELRRLTSDDDIWPADDS